MQNRILKSALTLALVALAAALLAAAQPLQRPLVVYSPHGPGILQLAEAAMRKAYPGVKLDWRFMGAEEAHQKLRSERDKPVADVWWGGPQFTFIQAARAGLLAPYDSQAAAAIPAAFRDAKHYWVGDQQTPVTIVYNHESLPRELVPKDWDDLLRPELDGRLVLRYPPGSGSMVAVMAALVDRQLAAGRSLKDAQDWLRRLDGQVGRYVGHSQVMFSTLGKGLLGIGIWNLPDVLMKVSEGYPVTGVFPTSGMPVIVDCIGLVRRPDAHPAARAFYDLMISPELATALASEPYFRASTRGDVPKSARPAFVDDPRYRAMAVDWDLVAEQSPAWLEAWEAGIPAERRPRP